MAPASIARTMRSTSRSRSTAKCARASYPSTSATRCWSGMTNDVSDLVLEDDRLQTLALSIAESGRAAGASQPGADDRDPRGFGPARPQGRGPCRVERRSDPPGTGESRTYPARARRGVVDGKACVPGRGGGAEPAPDRPDGAAALRRLSQAMRKAHEQAIRTHRLRNEILATKVANRFVNRLGPGVAFDLTDEEGASLGQVITAFLVAERLLDLGKLWREIEEEPLPEAVRIELFSIAAASVRSHLSDILRSAGGEASVSNLCKMLESGVRKIGVAATKLIRTEVRNAAADRREHLISLGASAEIVRGLVRLYELDGVFGIAALGCPPQVRRAVVDPRLHQAWRSAGARLGAAASRPLRSLDPVGAAAQRRPRARFRAAADRVPVAGQDQISGRSSRRTGSRRTSRGSSNSAS